MNPLDFLKKHPLPDGIKREWCNDEGETPGRYLYFSAVTRDGFGHATIEKALEELRIGIPAP